MFINWDVTTRFDPNSLQPSTHGIPIPSYGNYGGPNYSAGVEGGTTPETPTNPAPVDALDFLFWQHDLVYQHVQNGAAPPTAIAPADVHLVEGMYGLTQTDFFNNNPEALLYDALGTLTIVSKILTTPEEFAYFQTLPDLEKAVVVEALHEAVPNFEIGLAETPGNESRSLHGAFHVFEAHFAENIAPAVSGAFGTLIDPVTNSSINSNGPQQETLAPEFGQNTTGHVLANDPGSLSVTNVNGLAADVGHHAVTGAASSHAADTFVFAPNFGENTITNFNFHKDTLELPKSEFADLSAVLADAHQNGADTIIAHDAHDIITLHNVSLSQLHDSHILLV